MTGRIKVLAVSAAILAAAGNLVRSEKLPAILFAWIEASFSSENQNQSQPPLLSLTREMRIDGAAEDLTSIGWVAIWDDGQIAFSQLQDRQVLFYDSTGRRLGAFGRAGQGPGEFDFPNYGGLAGDTLWVRDTRQNRVTLITRNRTMAGTIATLQATPKANETNRYPIFNFAFPVAIAPNGGMITSGIRSRGAVLPSGFDTSGTPFLRVNRRMEIETIVFRKPEQIGGTRVSVSLPGGGSAGSAIPFAQNDLESWSRNGSLYAFATADTGARASSFRVVLLRSTGDTVFTRRYPMQVERIPARVADSAVTASLQRISRGPMPPELANAFRTQVKVPPIYPPLFLIHVGRDGSVWIGLRPSADQRSWIALDQQGNPFGRVQLPARSILREATLRQLWVIEHNADDIDSLVRYRVSRTSS